MVAKDRRGKAKSLSTATLSGEAEARTVAATIGAERKHCSMAVSRTVSMFAEDRGWSAAPEQCKGKWRNEYLVVLGIFCAARNSHNSLTARTARTAASSRIDCSCTRDSRRSRKLRSTSMSRNAWSSGSFHRSCKSFASSRYCRSERSRGSSVWVSGSRNEPSIVWYLSDEAWYSCRDLVTTDEHKIVQHVVNKRRWADLGCTERNRYSSCEGIGEVRFGSRKSFSV